MKVKLYNQAAEAIGETELPEPLFSQTFNADVVHQVVRIMRTNQRKPVAHVKNRAEVRGGGKKPWPQKGTGRARHGSSRSPIWRGGGVTHGPTKERNFHRKVNQKVNQKAIAMMLSEKVKRDEIRVVDSFEFPNSKTKEARNVFDHFLKSDQKLQTALLLLPPKSENIVRAVRNLPDIKALPASQVNVLDLLERRFVFMPQASIKVLEQTFSKVRN